MTKRKRRSRIDGPAASTAPPATPAALMPSKQSKQALSYAEKFVDFTPGQPAPRQLVGNIRRLDAAPASR